MTDRVGAQTVGRAIELLKLVASSRTRNLRLSEIAEMTSLEKSTAHRLLQRLVHERLLRHAPMHGYALGPLLYELGLGARPDANLRELAGTALGELAQATGDASFLVTRSGFDSVCMRRIPGHFPIQTMTSAAGDRHPLGAGVGGLAILASLKAAEVRAIVDHVQRRLYAYGLSAGTLLDAVELTRRGRGLAVDEGRVASGVTALGLAIPNKLGASTSAIFVASMSDRMLGSHRARVERELRQSVAEVTQLIRR